MSADALTVPAASVAKAAPTSAAKLNLLGVTREALTELIESLGRRPFHAQQIMRWLYQRRVLDFNAMTDLSQDLRRDLREIGSLETPRVASIEESADGTRKWLLDVGAGQAIETVFIPEPRRKVLLRRA